jgi:hypothetical protein
MVYWVIAKLAPPTTGVPANAPPVERLGPFESRTLAAKAREAIVTRYRGQPEAKVEIVCDFS